MAGNSLAYQFKTASVVIKIIVINAVLFIGVNLFSFLMDTSVYNLTKWFVLPDALGEVALQPWSFFTYSFLHAGFWHILFNMLWLHWFGGYVLNLFTEKRFLTVYLLGSLFAGLLFVISYNVFPAFETTQGYLLGASGAVMAIMVFIATYTPQATIRIFMFNLKLWHVAAFFVVFDLVRLPGSGNAGGLLAHLGGALFGYVYARQLLNGKDIGVWFEKMMDGVANLFKTRKQKPFKKVHRNKTTESKTKRSKTKESKNNHQKKVDAILDKIGKSGYESLTKAEKDFLFKAGKDN